MSTKARLVITAVIVEGRSQADVARDYRVSKGWVSKLVARYRAEGDSAFEPRSRRPHSSPNATPATTIELITSERQRLIAQGVDAGPDTIRWHLEHAHHVKVSYSTIARALTRAGLVTPTPSKRPKSSYIRFQAEQPNECWQSDFTHYRLATGVDTEILSWLDDHARFALQVTAHLRVTGTNVLHTFRQACADHGIPASTLTDNGLVYTARFAGGRGGRNAFETELAHLRVHQKNSRPNHPTTCGKVERFQQTMKNWLRNQPDQPSTIAELQHLLDIFIVIYNEQRPHRSLEHRSTPAVAYQARPKATPSQRDPDPHRRIRRDRVGATGKVTLRHNSHLYKIAIGRTHARTPIIMLIHDLDIRIIHAATGEILRHLTLDTTHTYQGLNTTNPENKQQPEPNRGSGPFPIS